MRITHIFKGIKLFSVNSKAKNEPRKGKVAFYRKTDNMALMWWTLWKEGVKSFSSKSKRGLGQRRSFIRFLKFYFAAKLFTRAYTILLLWLRVIQQTVKRQKRNLSFPFEKWGVSCFISYLFRYDNLRAMRKITQTALPPFGGCKSSPLNSFSKLFKLYFIEKSLYYISTKTFLSALA